MDGMGVVRQTTAGSGVAVQDLHGLKSQALLRQDGKV